MFIRLHGYFLLLSLPGLEKKKGQRERINVVVGRIKIVETGGSSSPDKGRHAASGVGGFGLAPSGGIGNTGSIVIVLTPLQLQHNQFMCCVYILFPSPHSFIPSLHIICMCVSISWEIYWAGEVPGKAQESFRERWLKRVFGLKCCRTHFLLFRASFSNNKATL